MDVRLAAVAIVLLAGCAGPTAHPGATARDLGEQREWRGELPTWEDGDWWEWRAHWTSDASERTTLPPHQEGNQTIWVEIVKANVSAGPMDVALVAGRYGPAHDGGAVRPIVFAIALNNMTLYDVKATRGSTCGPNDIGMPPFVGRLGEGHPVAPPLPLLIGTSWTSGPLSQVRQLGHENVQTPIGPILSAHVRVESVFHSGPSAPQGVQTTDTTATKDVWYSPLLQAPTRVLESHRTTFTDTDVPEGYWVSGSKDSVLSDFGHGVPTSPSALLDALQQ